MKTSFCLALSICLLLTISACSPNVTTALAPTLTPTATAPSATPINLTRSDDKQWKIPPLHGCTILTPKDLSDLYSAEVNQPLSQSNHADQAIFSSDRVSVNELSCVYLAFHRPSSDTGTFYQVTYWADTPDQATPTEWNQVWTDSAAKALQAIPNIGESAFYSNGRLTFKMNNTYVTIEVLSNRFDTKTPVGVSQQIELEKAIALKALNRMG